ncbi:GNAT family N-acetyltransferase [Nocardia pseudovaccinii]|uniref:GNAT family N-acetyltransferase n=1 Tax=Nocardia pseudovaccinii TaxID=189540 RepID=UPI003D8F952B
MNVQQGEGRMNQLPMLSAVRIETERVLLRKARDADRERIIELQTDPEVWAYIGVPRLREDVEQRLDAIGGTANATATPGHFVIADRTTDDLIGTFELKRRAADHPGHVTDDGEELELGYLMRRAAWGAGLAFEAAAAALRAAADELPDQPVLIATQTANKRSLRLATRLGFQPVSTFEWFDADQTLCLASLHSFKA